MFAFLCLFFLVNQYFSNPSSHVYASPLAPATVTNSSGNEVYNKGQQIINEVIPLEAREFYDNLTANDRQVLQKVISKAPTYASLKEVLTDVRNGSSTLYEKAVQLVTGLRGTVAKLSPPARAFIDQSVEQIQSALNLAFSFDAIKTQANELVQRYQALEIDTKEELKTAFPMVATIIENPVVQMLASGLLNIQQNA